MAEVERSPGTKAVRHVGPVKNIAAMLSEPGRTWRGEAPATEDALAILREHAPVELPQEYYELLRCCDGGIGALGIEPFYFILYSASEAAQVNGDVQLSELYPGFFVFGSNGGGEAIAFDVRGVPPWPVAMYDRAAGIDSSMVIARDIASFISAIGVEPDEEAGFPT